MNWFSITLILLVTVMLLPFRLLAAELKNWSCWKDFLNYERTVGKLENNTQRINFLENCRQADLIPRFLKFRVPNNGCFDEKSVQEFQGKLLRKELYTAKDDLKRCHEKLKQIRATVCAKVPRKLLPSIAVYTRISRVEFRCELVRKHSRKLAMLSQEQERPLFNVKNTVVLCGLDKNPPSYIMQTLSLGPKNAVLDKFNPHDILAELDELLVHCKRNGISEETVSDINIKTLNYIKRCKKLKSSRNILLTKRYLNENDLVAVPFDKGIGICVMKRQDYHQKLDDILNLPQFEKVIKPRKNAIHPVLKEEERIVNVLKQLRDDGKVTRDLYKKLKPRGSQPARLYGLGKVHKTAIPTRPVLSMPGSSYYKIGVQVAEWLSKVPACQINASTKEIADSLKNVQLEEDEELVSFDVSSLYTNVPVMEAIDICTELLFDGNQEAPPVDKETFKVLAQISSCNVIMLTHNGYYRQTDGLAMGSPPAPHLANGWMSTHDDKIAEGSKLYFRYMDDIIRDIKTRKIEEKLVEINNIHPKLNFTIERQQKVRQEGQIPFLDMRIINRNGQLSSTWYSKPSDTGLIMNFHALAPKRYKRSVVSGFVHRIYRACSSWANVHASLEKAKQILEHNQYPPMFYNPIIEETLSKILENENKEKPAVEQHGQQEEGNNDVRRQLFFLQYRGKASEDFARALHKINAPCTVVMTLRKLKTVLPSLKPAVDKFLRSGVVYQIKCPRCGARYVGYTCRHLVTRFKEHLQPSKTVKKHLQRCRTNVHLMKDVEILDSSARGEVYLQIREALWIKETSPTINVKDEFKSRALTLKW